MISRSKDLKHHIWFMPNDWSIQLFDITIPCLRTYEIDSLLLKLKVIRIQGNFLGWTWWTLTNESGRPNLDGPTVWPNFFNQRATWKVIRKQGHFLGWTWWTVPSESGRPYSGRSFETFSSKTLSSCHADSLTNKIQFRKCEKKFVKTWLLWSTGINFENKLWCLG